MEEEDSGRKGGPAGSIGRIRAEVSVWEPGLFKGVYIVSMLHLSLIWLNQKGMFTDKWRVK